MNELIIHVACSFNYSIEYIKSMDLYWFLLCLNYTKKNPPTHMLVKSFLGYKNEDKEEIINENKKAKDVLKDTFDSKSFKEGKSITSSFFKG